MGWLARLLQPQGNIKEISVSELHDSLRQANGTGPVLLDVRERDEFRGGHIPGAKLIPLGQLRQRVNELPKDRPIVCICRTGRRSGIAASHLANAGFEDVTNLVGGMMAWQRKGYSVDR
jgi:rhodanese-related sulfurtransferase